MLLDYEDKKEILAELERRKKARAINVTVDDDTIKQQLRSLNQPICEYGFWVIILPTLGHNSLRQFLVAI